MKLVYCDQKKKPLRRDSRWSLECRPGRPRACRRAEAGRAQGRARAAQLGQEHASPTARRPFPPLPFPRPSDRAVRKESPATGPGSLPQCPPQGTGRSTAGAPRTRREWRGEAGPCTS